jgi:septal ring factor EnvC (AmiA/AmiB activator)
VHVVPAESEAYNDILKLMRNVKCMLIFQQNRPYSAQNVSDMLRGEVKKPTAQKLLDQMVEENVVIAKQYSIKVYLASQDFFDKVDSSKIEAIEGEINESKVKLDKFKSDNTKMTQELKGLSIELTNEELTDKLDEYKNEVNELEKRIRKLDKKDEVQISADKVKDAEESYGKYIDKFKKMKKIYKNILDTISESLEVTKKELVVYMVS